MSFVLHTSCGCMFVYVFSERTAAQSDGQPRSKAMPEKKLAVSAGHAMAIAMANAALADAETKQRSQTPRGDPTPDCNPASRPPRGCSYFRSCCPSLTDPSPAPENADPVGRSVGARSVPAGRWLVRDTTIGPVST